MGVRVCSVLHRCASVGLGPWVSNSGRGDAGVGVSVGLGAHVGGAGWGELECDRQT
jgi:hypothetical protein